MSSPQPVVNLESVSKVYRLGDQEIRALDGISLRIEPGEFAAITGPSGSGKSTLMHLLGCLDTPTSGRMEVCGHDLTQAGDKQLARARNEEIGFVFQSFNLLPKLNVIENIELPMIYLGIPGGQRRRRAQELAEQVQLAGRFHNRPSQLSGGQCQRVAIARALANDPKLLLADEPTGNLDSATGEKILNMFHEFHAAGRTIILVTHDAEVANVAKRVIEIKDGKVRREYAP